MFRSKRNGTINCNNSSTNSNGTLAGTISCQCIDYSGVNSNEVVIRVQKPKEVLCNYFFDIQKGGLTCKFYINDVVIFEKKVGGRGNGSFILPFVQDTCTRVEWVGINSSGTFIINWTNN